MTKKKSENSFINNFSMEDVSNLEHGKYTIQVGPDFLNYNGKMAFDLDRAQMLYNKALDGLYELVQNGTEEEREEAYAYILMINIRPLRIH